MTSDRWSACLDRFEAHLRRQREHVEKGNGHLVEAFEPDAGLEPLPAGHRARALRLHQENETLIGMLCIARDGASADLRRADAPAAANASYLDVRA